MEKEKIVAILYGYRETRARANCLREEITLLEKLYEKTKEPEKLIEINALAARPAMVGGRGGMPGDPAAKLAIEAADGGAAYGRRVYTVTAEAGAELTVFEVCTAAQPLAAELRLTAAEGAHLRVVQLLNPTRGAVLRHELSAQLAEHAKLDLISLQLGDGAVYADHQIALAGDGAALRADLGYLARRSDTADIDLTVEQLGKSTVSEIHASGALMERAKKVFRGTIDFKHGSAGSVGSENETVLLLGEDAENKTVPVILCAEENVEGSHGATIGELDADTLFYFASRGIDRAAAEAILARAAVERLARMAEDEAFSARALGALAQVLCMKEERE